MSADPELHRVEHLGLVFQTVVPEGLVLDPLVVRRLARRLAAADPDVSAVLADPAPVPPGSSARVQAERALARSGGEPALALVAESRCRAAGVARSGSGVVVAGAMLEIGGTRVMRDPGAVVAEVSVRQAGELVDADPTGRPIFTRRPVVLVGVGTETPPDHAWMRTESLIDEGIEARLALSSPSSLPGGRSPACALSPSTVTALRPDVVIACDPVVADRLESWHRERYTVVIEVAAAMADRAELVPWRHGVARGRVRARIGPDVAPSVLADLVRRLCGGPPPELPQGIDARIDSTDVDPPPRRTTFRRRAAGPVRSVWLVGAPSGADDRGRWAAVAEQFGFLGCSVTRSTSLPDDPDDHRLVLIGSSTSAAGAGLGDRIDHGERVAVLVGHGDVVVDASGSPQLTDGARALVDVAGRALVPSEALVVAANRSGWRARYLPSTVGWQRVAQLQATGTSRPAGGEAVVGWITAPGFHHPAIEDELAAWLDAEPSGAVVVSASSGGAAGPLSGHPRVSVVDRFDAVDAAGWMGVVWSPDPGRAVGAGEVLTAVELALTGVPLFATREMSTGLGGLGELARPLDRAILALGPTEARNRGRALHDRAAALHGSQSVAVRAHRVLGWLLRDDA